MKIRGFLFECSKKTLSFLGDFFKVLKFFVHQYTSEASKSYYWGGITSKGWELSKCDHQVCPRLSRLLRDISSKRLDKHAEKEL